MSEHFLKQRTPFCVSSLAKGKRALLLRDFKKRVQKDSPSVDSSPTPASARAFRGTACPTHAPRLVPLTRSYSFHFGQLCIPVSSPSCSAKGLSAPFSLVSAEDPKVASIANRVAEIVYSWPPPEEHTQGGSIKFRGTLAPQIAFISEGRSSQPRAASAQKGKLPLSEHFQAEVYKRSCPDSAWRSAV